MLEISPVWDHELQLQEIPRTWMCLIDKKACVTGGHRSGNRRSEYDKLSIMCQPFCKYSMLRGLLNPPKGYFSRNGEPNLPNYQAGQATVGCLQYISYQQDDMLKIPLTC